MTDVVRIVKENEVYMKVYAERSVLCELSEFFSFRPNNYQFNPKYKAGFWDGYIRLLAPFKPFLYIGLIDQLRKFCELREYDLIVDPELEDELDIPDDFGYQLYDEFISEEFRVDRPLREYQNEYIVNAIRRKRALSLSPTSSGKSLMIYLIHMHYLQTYGHRTMIIVPTVGLLHQMFTDFVEYGCDPKSIYKIQGGVDKNTQCDVVITTWHSLKNVSDDWLHQFKVVVGDEAHLFAAKSLTTIMEKLVHTPYRFGFTGTVDSESKTHEMVLQGLFGETKRYVTTKQLIDSGAVATFNIKAIVLQHPQDVRAELKAQMKKAKKRGYHVEKDFLNKNERRNLFIRNLVWSLKDQNNLILFDRIEDHGKPLEALLRKEGRILHFIHGGTSGEERERIRQWIENDPLKQHDILASFGTTSTGTSIKRIDNAIFGSAYRSEIKTLQSIGRTLRKGNGADDATLYDIADDLSIGSHSNYTLEHFKRRVQIYSAEQFKFSIHNFNLSS